MPKKPLEIFIRHHEGDVYVLEVRGSGSKRDIDITSVVSDIVSYKGQDKAPDTDAYQKKLETKLNVARLWLADLETECRDREKKENIRVLLKEVDLLLKPRKGV